MWPHGCTHTHPCPQGPTRCSKRKQAHHSPRPRSCVTQRSVSLQVVHRTGILRPSFLRLGLPEQRGCCGDLGWAWELSTEAT